MRHTLKTKIRVNKIRAAKAVQLYNAGHAEANDLMQSTIIAARKKKKNITTAVVEILPVTQAIGERANNFASIAACYNRRITRLEDYA